MNKNQYLEELYQELQKYNTDMVVKHVTEYDYIISDMLEDDNFDVVIEKLGNPQALAASIVEEFGYEPKQTNQYSNPIIGTHEKYEATQKNSTLITVLEILFVIGSIIYFLTVASLLFTIFVVVAVSAFISLGGTLLFILGMISSVVFFISLYMIVFNLRRMLYAHLRNEPAKGGM